MNMIAETQIPLESIAKYCELPLEKVEELAEQTIVELIRQSLEQQTPDARKARLAEIVDLSKDPVRVNVPVLAEFVAELLPGVDGKKAVQSLDSGFYDTLVGWAREAEPGIGRTKM